MDRYTLRVDVKDYTHAVRTDGLSQDVAVVEFGAASDCFGAGSHLGHAVIDLRGTPFAVEDLGAGLITCSVSSTGASSGESCSQWKLDGWSPSMEVTCSDENQLCDIRCGGSSGGCILAAEYLQLKILNITLYESVCPVPGFVPRKSPIRLCFFISCRQTAAGRTLPLFFLPSIVPSFIEWLPFLPSVLPSFLPSLTSFLFLDFLPFP